MAEAILSAGTFINENDVSFVQSAPVAVGAAFIGPTVKGPVEEPTIITSYGDYQRTFGDTFYSSSIKKEFLTSLAVKSYFQQGGQTALITRVVSGSFTSAANTQISASAKGSTQPFTLATLGKGAIYNSSGSLRSDGSLASGSSDNVRWEISGVNNSSGVFSLTIRRGDDNHKSKIILETFSNLSLDPNSDRYVEYVIGNQYKSKRTDGSSTFVDVFGEYPNKSKYVRVSAVNLPTPSYILTDGSTVGTDSSGTSYSASLPIAGSGSFTGATGNIVVGGDNYFSQISGSTTRSQGLTAGNYTDAITILGNSDEYRFKVITTPGLTYDGFSTTLDSLVSLAEDRGDCIAVIDLVGYKSTVSEVTAEAAGVNSSYAAAYWPWIQIPTSMGKNEFVPASTIIPGVYAFTERTKAPWFAPAGIVNGGIPNAIQPERKLVRTERDTLQASNVNPIANLPGVGVVVYGQKTLQKKASALDRVNVRNLLSELKAFVKNISDGLAFEQNTINTRNRFLSQVRPYMESVVDRQGLYAFEVVMDDTLNTPDVVDRNQIIGKIRIQPTKTAEFIILDFTIDPTGTNFGA